MKKFKWLALATVVLLTACTSSRITSSWNARNIQGKNYQKILVLGLIHNDDRRLQQKMEEHMAGDLKELGYNVVTSMEEFGPRVFDNLTESEALAKLKNSGIDAVVTIVLLNKKSEKLFVPTAPGYNRNRIYFDGYRHYYTNFWNYYGTTRGRVIEPGYYVDDTEYFWESNFYELKDQALLYSVQTQSFNPASTESLAHEYGVMIVKNMVKKNVLGKQAGGMKKSF